MNNIKWFLEFTTDSIDHFLAVAFLIGLPFTFIFRMYNRYLRSKNIQAHGYPPPHCDADGDSVNILKDVDEN